MLTFRTLSGRFISDVKWVLGKEHYYFKHVSLDRRSEKHSPYTHVHVHTVNYDNIGFAPNKNSTKHVRRVT